LLLRMRVAVIAATPWWIQPSSGPGAALSSGVPIGPITPHQKSR
jgi:hypothetical protein